jgi:hypothetical protein
MLSLDLFEKIPGVRISIGAFQDYNDDYMWKSQDFTVEQESLISFMENLKKIFAFFVLFMFA